MTMSGANSAVAVTASSAQQLDLGIAVNERGTSGLSLEEPQSGCERLAPMALAVMIDCRFAEDPRLGAAGLNSCDEHRPGSISYMLPRVSGDLVKNSSSV